MRSELHVQGMDEHRTNRLDGADASGRLGLGSDIGRSYAAVALPGGKSERADRLWCSVASAQDYGICPHRCSLLFQRGGVSTNPEMMIVYYFTWLEEDEKCKI